MQGPSRSEVNLSAKLDDSETAHAGVCVRVRAPVGVFRDCQRVIGICILPRSTKIGAVVLVIEVGVIECVKRLESELDITLFVTAQWNVLKQRQIPILHAAVLEEVTASASRRANSGYQGVPALVHTVVIRNRAVLV